MGKFGREAIPLSLHLGEPEETDTLGSVVKTLT